MEYFGASSCDQNLQQKPSDGIYEQRSSLDNIRCRPDRATIPQSPVSSDSELVGAGRVACLELEVGYVQMDRGTSADDGLSYGKRSQEGHRSNNLEGSSTCGYYGYEGQQEPTVRLRF